MKAIIPFFPNPFNEEDIDNIINEKSEIDISRLGFNPSLYQFVDSGRSGIRLLLRSFGLPKKSRIGIPIMLCNTVLRAIVQEGFKPYYFNVDRDLQLVFNKLDFEKSKISALILPHLYGVIHPDTERIIDWCKENNKYLIQDTAQSYGLIFKNKPLIEYGDGGIYSFGPGKASTAAGGGIVYGLKTKIRYDNLPIILKKMIEKKVRIFLISRTVGYGNNSINKLSKIANYLINFLAEKYIYSINKIQFNAIKMMVGRVGVIQNKREKNWCIMNEILQKLSEQIYIPKNMERSLKYKYLIMINEQGDKVKEFEMKMAQQRILINRIKRRDPINNNEFTMNGKYFEISTESSIPQDNMYIAAKIIRNYLLEKVQ